MNKSERVSVKYPGGALAPSVTASEAQAMIRAGVAKSMGGTRNTYRCIQLHEGPSRPVAGTKYSDNREHADNPRGAWRLRPMPEPHLKMPDKEAGKIREHIFLCFRGALVQCGAEVRTA